MQPRVKFRKGEQIRFLKKIEHISGLNRSKLADIARIVTRSYCDWRREKLCMSLFALRTYSVRFGVKLPESEEGLVKRAIKYRRLAGRQGGLACYKKYGNIATEVGRKKGGSKTIMILREKGTIPLPNHYIFPENYNADLAEFVGILLGDGGITNSQVCVTLNSKADEEYLYYVLDLIKRLFSFNAPWTKRKDCNANTIYCSGISLVNYLTSVGLKVGNKVELQVGVPDWILADANYSLRCVRGLVDTDGCIVVHRYQVNGKKYRYRKLIFSNRSVPLLEFVYRVLVERGLSPKLVAKGDNKQIWLYNQAEVGQYLRMVGTHNPRLTKYL